MLTYCKENDGVFWFSCFVLDKALLGSICPTPASQVAGRQVQATSGSFRQDLATLPRGCEQPAALASWKQAQVSAPNLNTAIKQ